MADKPLALPAGEILIVSGPPGSGKTTLAAQLATQVRRGVHIESDWFFRSIRTGLIPPHLPESTDQNDAVIDIAADTAVGYARAGFGVVWDGIVGPWYLDRVVGRLRRSNVTAHYAIIRPDREVCLERVRRRDDTADTSGAEVMYDQFTDLGEFEHHVIDDRETDLTLIGHIDACLSSGSLTLAVGA